MSLLKQSPFIMLLIFLLSAIVCFCQSHTIFNHSVLKNVAYAKPVKLSSDYVYSIYPGSNAVNGVLSDFAHTSTEKSPWLRIDLGARFMIHEIEVFARPNCCGMYLIDFIVYV